MAEPTTSREHIVSKAAVVRAIASLLHAVAPRQLYAGLLRVIAEDRVVAGVAGCYALVSMGLVFWDLPSTICWENDGVTPHNHFHAVVNNLKPGSGYRYPLFHNLVLAAATLPVLFVAILSGSLSIAAIESRLMAVSTLTCISVIIKGIHVAMGAAVLLLLGRLSRRLFGVNAGRGAVLLACVSVTLSYYGRTSNLDGPSLFYILLALDRLCSVIERRMRIDVLLLGLFVAAAVATKDQSYASLVLTLPIYYWWLSRRSLDKSIAPSGEPMRLRTLLSSIVGSYLVLSGALVNPTGFVARLRMLTGPNTEEWRVYEKSIDGVLRNLWDLWLSQSKFFFHPILVGCCWLGLLWAVLAPQRDTALGSRFCRAMPMVAAISSVLCFTLPVARCEHRFVLPLNAFLCVYGGALLATLWCYRKLTWPLLCVGTIGSVFSLWQCAVLAMSQWGDARRSTEEYLSELPQGTLVELHGFRVFQPRIDSSDRAPYRVIHVGKEELKRRPKIPGYREVNDKFWNLSSRAPDVVIFPEGYVERYMQQSLRPGQVLSGQRKSALADHDAVSFYAAALADKIPGYRLALVFAPKLPPFARRFSASPIAIHDFSTGGRLWVLEKAGMVRSREGKL